MPNTQSPIFIGGTGRSGTTLLYDIMRQHPAIFAPPKEMRFMIDPGGLLNLLSALTTDFSPAQAGKAWLQTQQMMQKDLLRPSTSPYRFYEIQSFMGAGYPDQVKRYLNSLLHGSFEGEAAWMEDPSLNGWLGWWQKLRNRMAFLPDWGKKVRPVIPVVRYFPDREELLAQTRSFLIELFSEPMIAADKQLWCEKTPHNKLHLGFLWELFPEALFVHMKRDPRGVAWSYIRQTWASPDLQTSCLQLADIYEAWFQQRELVDSRGKQSQFLEIKLEDFSREPSRLLEKIAHYYQLGHEFPLPEEIDPQKVNNWQDKVSATDLQLMNKILGPYIRKMGYEL